MRPRYIGAAAPTDLSSVTEGDTPMTARTSDELGKIEAAEELQIVLPRRDGTLRKPVTIERSSATEMTSRSDR
jgi:hypothetical protein